MQAIVGHDGLGERAGRSINSIEKRGLEQTSRLVMQVGRDGHGIGRTGDQDRLAEVRDDGCNVAAMDRIDQPRRSLGNVATRPVLSLLIGHVGIDQFQRPPTGIMQRIPAPAIMSLVVWSAHALSPIALVGVLDNLLKGAATQAVQNLNLAFGLDAMTGLENRRGTRS